MGLFWLMKEKGIHPKKKKKKGKKKFFLSVLVMIFFIKEITPLSFSHILTASKRMKCKAQLLGFLC
jgi:hypothetical protein